MKNKMLIFVLFLLVICGCTAKLVESEVMFEEAKVVKTIFEPSRDGSSSGLGVNMSDGSVSLVSSDVHINEKYSVVFECQHGQFAIQGESKQSKAFAIWRKVKVGQLVNVEYRELYDIKKDGSKVFHDFKFEDANPK